ncbi:MAG: carboxypeptidase M32 [Burkholderiaceae bacterium]
MSDYDELMKFQRETEALAQIAGRLGWDQETMMPPGAAEQRSEEMAAMEGVMHQRRTDPQLGDWLARCEATDAASKANLRLIRRRFERSLRVPARLAAEIARVTSVAQSIWAAARRAEDVTAFLPTLANVIALRREEGAALAAGGDVYDALLDEYEPGATSASISDLFSALRPRLVALRAAALAAAPAPRLRGQFDEAGQLAVSRRLAEAFGYDFNRGRIDKAVHPFSSGSGADVRITTRTNLADPFNCFYSTVHEVGHAAYEQGIAPEHALTPVGQGVSMGVHESQSRIYENQLGRSRAFTGWLFGRMRDQFGDIGIRDEDDFYRAVNAVTNGYIRTESDEVQYNLHVMLRFDLERALIRGDLKVNDLEAAWNDRFLADFGFAVDRASNGCLQDVHWAAGLIGYFPTYTLGNVYAGCLHKALRAAIPDLDTQLARGDTSQATAWLRDKVHRHGGLSEPAATIQRATGGAVSEAPLLDYLEAKFRSL